jgi:hypothetical protein
VPPRPPPLQTTASLGQPEATHYCSPYRPDATHYCSPYRPEAAGARSCPPEAPSTLARALASGHGDVAIGGVRWTDALGQVRTPSEPLPPPPLPPRTNRTRRVPHPVRIGHAASLTPYESDTPRPSPRSRWGLSAPCRSARRGIADPRAAPARPSRRCRRPAHPRARAPAALRLLVRGLDEPPCDCRAGEDHRRGAGAACQPCAQRARRAAGSRGAAACAAARETRAAVPARGKPRCRRRGCLLSRRARGRLHVQGLLVAFLKSLDFLRAHGTPS